MESPYAHPAQALLEELQPLQRFDRVHRSLQRQMHVEAFKQGAGSVDRELAFGERQIVDAALERGERLAGCTVDRKLGPGWAPLGRPANGVRGRRTPDQGSLFDEVAKPADLNHRS